jgi:malate dehydrogenase
VTGSADWEEAAGSRIVILAGGRAEGRAGRAPDAVERAAAAAAQVTVRCPDAVVIVAAEPAAPICRLMLERTYFPRQRVIGLGPVVDSARLCALLASELDVSARDVTAFVLGGPGEAMVPALSVATVAGAPVADRIAPDRLAAIVASLEAGGGGTPGQEDTGGARFAPAPAAREIVDAIVLDRKRVLACAAQCHGEYGIDRAVVGVPVRLGAAGIEEILELPLSAAERDALQRAAVTLAEAAVA